MAEPKKEDVSRETVVGTLFTEQEKKILIRALMDYHSNIERSMTKAKTKGDEELQRHFARKAAEVGYMLNGHDLFKEYKS